MARRSEAAPLLATERNPNRETIGRRHGNIARKITSGSDRGFQGFMPWQQLVADVAGEVDPATGGLWYRTVVLQGLRQIGKTTLGRAQCTDTALFHPGALVIYTAQTKTMAEQRLRRDFYLPLADSPLNIYLDQAVGRRAGTPGFNGKTGSNQIAFANRSIWGVDAVKDDSAHGPALRRGLIDEAFAHKDASLEAGMVPAMSTFDDAQLGIYSAAGNADSEYFRKRTDAAEAVLRLELEKPLAERTSRTAYFRFAAPRDADRYDPETWWSCHPALGWTISEGTVQGALESFESSEPEEFDRAYLGWWATKRLKKWIVPQLLWETTSIEPEAAEWDRPIWAVDISPERDWASIGYAAPTSTGPWLEVVAHGPGTRWLAGQLRKLRREFGGDVVAIDRKVATRALVREFEDDGFLVRELNEREVVDACMNLFDAAVSERLVHSKTDTDLDGALASAVKLNVGDGAWKFGRGKSLQDISPLYAVTLALFVLIETFGDDYDLLQSFHGSGTDDE